MNSLLLMSEQIMLLNAYLIPLVTSEFSKILIFTVIALIICSIMLLIAYFFSLNVIKDSEKLSEYECGFDPSDNATRQPFDVHFYIVGILFLIFDVEIAIIFP